MVLLPKISERIKEDALPLLGMGACTALVVASLAVVTEPFAQASEDYDPGQTSEPLESNVAFVDAAVDAAYTDQGAVPEEVGDTQQIEAVTAVEDLNGGSQSRNVVLGQVAVSMVRADIDSDNVLVGVTWDVDSVAPDSVHLRFLQDSVWSEWAELEEETTGVAEASAAKRGGTEPFSLFNAEAVEVIAEAADDEVVDGLSVVVISADVEGGVENALEFIDGDERLEDEDGLGEEVLIDPVEEEPRSGSELSDDGRQAEEDIVLDDDGVVTVDQTSYMQAASRMLMPTALNSAGTVYDTGFSGLKINTRKAWGAPAGPANVVPITVKGAVVHYTLSTDNYTKDQVAQQIRNMNHYHAVTNGWGDIGYNLIVDKFGTVWEGRAGGLTKGVQGAHATGTNWDTFGITFLGGYNGGSPNATALDSFAKAIGWKLKVHGVTSVTGQASIKHSDGKWYSTPVISGHRDVGSTSCPGDVFYSKLPSLRASTAAYIAANASGSSTGSGSVAGVSSSTVFTPGNVISDSVFYNSAGMTEAQIKAFIQDTGKDCKPGSGTTCLKDSTFPTANLTSLRGGCKPLNMSGNQAPWTIIDKTAKACELNPQVILVTLQKEQSALTQPKSAASWAKAMGSGCPDGSGCDPAQGGFMKQVYYGSDKLVSYKLQSQAGHVDAFKEGRSMTIKHNPDTACGTQTVKFQNVATASLYEYTPYMGNAGKSGCAAVGQKMFWDLLKRYFPGSVPSTGTGWVQQGSYWYYYNPSTGDKQTGWVEVGSYWYYLDPSTGVMQTGWVKVGSYWYYLNLNGRMQSGWTQVYGDWYYLSPAGRMQAGWLQVNGKTYYLASSGVMQNGWSQVNGTWYYFNPSSGAMQTGWAKVGNYWYYLDSNGKMQTGWISLNGKQYYLSPAGRMQTGTLTIEDTTYVFSSSGSLVE